MASEDGPESTKAPGETLAALVSKRKAARSSGRGNGIPGQRASERRAGALAASKSRPAPRK
jgi:hypothetical protein